MLLDLLIERRRGGRPLMLRRWKIAVAPLLAFLTIGLDCRNPASLDPLGEWQRLLHLPGDPITGFDVAPDGTLFIATADAAFARFPSVQTAG
jgi:hypothetical protein